MTNEPKSIRADLRAVLTGNGVSADVLESGVEAVVSVFRSWLLTHASEHRGNADAAETVTMRSLELIFADEVEQLAKTLRPIREPVCKDPDTSPLLMP